MIKQIKIENYKSLVSLEMDLGRVNVLIGENGSGKTNILEAVALGSAAAADKLDDTYLHSKGIRLSEPRMMRSGFVKEQLNEIKIEFSSPSNKKNLYALSNDGNPYSKWTIKDGFAADVNEIINFLENKKLPDGSKVSYSLLKELIEKNISELKLEQFTIFAPENSSLRKFEVENGTGIGPLGDGLFNLLKLLSAEKPTDFKKIRRIVNIIDWAQDFEIPNDLMFTERRIRIRDRYLEEGIEYIDQRSSNEGFLYLLFYVTLFVSPYTPKFFAIDNVDNALNPKLCSKLLEVLVKLAKEHDKQVILTAHNPGLLDGLNLHDEEQRLFVISRNKQGHTKALRIEQKPSANGHEPVRLSEQFLRGYIGGLPKNF